MKVAIVISLLLITVIVNISFTSLTNLSRSLRKLYEQNPKEWSRPNVSENINWQELGILPVIPKLDISGKRKTCLLFKCYFSKPLTLLQTIVA